MTMKGITPVVSVILLLLVTIAMVGFAFGFFQRMLGIAGTSTETGLTTVSNQAAKTVRIDNIDAAASAVTVRNTGSQSIAAGEITVFSNGALQSCTWNPAMPLAKDASSACDFSASACTSGTVIKVVAPGNEDSLKC